MQEFIVDPRQSTPEELAEGMRQAQTLFKLNHTMPYTDEYNTLAEELFGHDVFADGGFVMPGLMGGLFRPREAGPRCENYEQLPDDGPRRHHHRRPRDGRRQRAAYQQQSRPPRPDVDHLQARPHRQGRLDRCGRHHPARRDRRRQRRGGRRRCGDQRRGPEHHCGRDSGEID